MAVQVFNNKYEDKYVRATYIYTKENSGTINAYADANTTVAINSADLYEIATKGAIVVTEDGEFFPVGVVKATDNAAAYVIIVGAVTADSKSVLGPVNVVAIDPED